MNTYHLGTMVRLAGAFTTGASVPTDPTTVTIIVRDPAGTETTYTYGGLGTVVKDSVGNYHQDVATDMRGVWYYEWQGTGTVTATWEEAFYCAEGEV